MHNEYENVQLCLAVLKLLEKLTFAYFCICYQNISPLILSSMIILQKKGKQLRKFLQKSNILQTGTTKAFYFSLESQKYSVKRTETIRKSHKKAETKINREKHIPSRMGK